MTAHQVWTKPIAIDSLAGDLDRAVGYFNVCVARVTEAQNFVNGHKGGLNEHQYQGRIDGANGDADAIKRITGNQARMRCSYQSGRLALFVSYSQLHRARLLAAKQVTQIVATMAHIEDFDDRNFVGGRALSLAHDFEHAFKTASDRHDREVDNDPTDGQAQIALEAAYHQLVKEGFNSQAPESPRHFNFVMCLIPVKQADLKESHPASATTNDELVVLAHQVICFLDSESYKASWNQYFVTKGRLNEPQYAQRLLQAAARNDAAVGVVKNQQAYGRIEFLNHRLAVAQSIKRLAVMATQLEKLIASLTAVVPAKGAKVPTLRLVAMNNILAADAIVRAVRQLIDRWDAEVLATKDVADVSQTSLCEELAVFSAREPFNSLRWIFGNDGRYVDLSGRTPS